MKKYKKVILPLACLTAIQLGGNLGTPILPLDAVISVAAASAQSSPVVLTGERRLAFNTGWQFKLGDVKGAEAVDFDDSSWRSLNVPHDWSIELNFDKNCPGGNGTGYLDGGVGWYRKTFTLPAKADGKKINIDFDGVYMNSEVWINGHYLGKYPYGYSSFQYDMTPYLKTDGSKNVLAVRVENNEPTSRWYSGSGIFRNVWLQVLNPVHIAQWGTVVTTPQVNLNSDKHEATVKTTSQLVNDTDKSQQVVLISKILDKSGKTVARSEKKQLLLANSQADITQNIQLASAELWSPDTPYLYNLTNEIRVDGKIVDKAETPFGVRKIKFDPDTGFWCNGKNIKLHGVCLHHDHGSLGAGWNERAMERELKIMKDMGVNALRSTHNPAVPAYLDMADKMGFFVIDEAFDCWETGKSKNDYSLVFDEWSERDLKAMIARDRNHPSIIMWSLGNEIPNRTYKTAKRLKGYVEELDTTRPVTMGNAGGNYDVDVADILGTVGYNYYEKAYDDDHAKHPDWVIYGSETASAVRSRGIYKLPLNKNFNEGEKDHQCSSYDNSVVPWGKSAEQSWIDDRDRPFVAGQFIWTGFDYIGEPTPYGDDAKSSYFGIVDTCGFPKDIYYFYKSQWTKQPTLHLLPDWNPSEDHSLGKTVPVWAYTNADSVELYLNGKSLGKKDYDPMGKVLHLEWNVPYTPGELKAVAKDKKGKIIATDVVKTSGAPAKLALKPDKKVMKADGKDLIYVEVDVLDKNGNFVPDASTQVDFAVTGGEIAGVDNGDATSFESYRGTSRKAFRGKCLLIVRAHNKGKVSISATTKEGVQGENITVKAN